MGWERVIMTQKLRILLIDDSEATVDGLKSFLDQKPIKGKTEIRRSIII